MAKTPPCEGCKIACTNYKRCGKYREWLRETWREVQALYGSEFVQSAKSVSEAD